MVYLDYNASTPIDPRVMPTVLAAMDRFGNPSSIQHFAGQDAAETIEGARVRVATMFGRPERDVIFTSGASEAAALGILGAALGARDHRPNLVVSATEHKAISAAAALAATMTGGAVRTANVDRSGRLDVDHLKSLVDDSVSVVAVMAANNETGVIGPVEQVVDAAEAAGAMSFIDATQAAGKAPIDAAQVADMLVCSSHKIYGPKGAGALVASRHIQRELTPLFAGGGQERGLRGGTQNVPAIAGFGAAAELAAKEQKADAHRLGALSSTLLTRLQSKLNGVELNAHDANRLCNTLNLRFHGADAEAVMSSMPRIAVSAGSACQSGVTTESHVLLAMGLSSTTASESLRISLGRPTTTDDITAAADELIRAVTRVRQMTHDLED